MRFIHYYGTVTILFFLYGMGVAIKYKQGINPVYLVYGTS